jgi:hypothetical protein
MEFNLIHTLNLAFPHCRVINATEADKPQTRHQMVLKGVQESKELEDRNKASEPIQLFSFLLHQKI